MRGHNKSDIRCTRNRGELVNLERLRGILISTFRSWETDDGLDSVLSCRRSRATLLAPRLCYASQTSAKACLLQAARI